MKSTFSDCYLSVYLIYCRYFSRKSHQTSVVYTLGPDLIKIGQWNRKQRYFVLILTNVHQLCAQNLSCLSYLSIFHTTVKNTSNSDHVTHFYWSRDTLLFKKNGLHCKKKFPKFYFFYLATQASFKIFRNSILQIFIFKF